MNAAA